MVRTTSRGSRIGGAISKRKWLYYLFRKLVNWGCKSQNGSLKEEDLMVLRKNGQHHTRSGHKQHKTRAGDAHIRQPPAGNAHAEQEHHGGHDNPQRCRIPQEPEPFPPLAGSVQMLLNHALRAHHNHFLPAVTQMLSLRSKASPVSSAAHHMRCRRISDRLS